MRTLIYRFACYVLLTIILIAALGDVGAYPKQILEAALQVRGVNLKDLWLDYRGQVCGLQIDYWLLVVFFGGLIDVSISLGVVTRRLTLKITEIVASGSSGFPRIQFGIDRAMYRLTQGALVVSVLGVIASVVGAISNLVEDIYLSKAIEASTNQGSGRQIDIIAPGELAKVALSWNHTKMIAIWTAFIILGILALQALWAWTTHYVKPGNRSQWLQHLVPSIFALGLPVGIIFVLQSNFVPQLSDILSPDGSRTAWLLIKLPFKILGSDRYSLIWLVSWGWTILLWFTASWHIYRCTDKIAKQNNLTTLRPSRLPEESGATPQRPSSNGILTRLVLFVHRLWKGWYGFAFKELKDEDVKRNRASYWDIVWRIWVGLAVLPLFSLLLYRLALNVYPLRVSAQPFALALSLSLVVLISLTVTLLVLASFMKPGLFLKVVTLLPLFALWFRIYGAYGTGDSGKNILNAGAPVWLTKDHPQNNDQIKPKANNRFPLIVITISGGGSRAAIYGAEMLSELWWKKGDYQKNAPTPDQVREALKAAGMQSAEIDIVVPSPDYYYPGRILLIRADIISSVSGGSLTNMYFVHSLWKIEKDLIAKGGDVSYPYTIRAQALKRFFEADKRVAANKKQEAKTLERFIEVANEQLELDLRYYEFLQLLKSRSRWVSDDMMLDHIEMNPFISAMAMDHLSPAVAGLGDLARGPGPSLEAFWNQKLGWTDDRRKPLTLSTFAPFEINGLLPRTIFNSVDALTGGRVAITNLNGTCFKPARTVGTVSEVQYDRVIKFKKLQGYGLLGITASNRMDSEPGRILVFGDIIPGYDMPISQVVRASSNVPYTFGPMRFSLKNQVAGKPIFQLFDGGAWDNTGIDTVLSVVRAYRIEYPEKPVFVFELDPSGFLMEQTVSDFGNVLNRDFVAAKAALKNSGQGSLGLLTAQAVSEIGAEVPRTVYFLIEDHSTDSHSVPSTYYVLGYSSSTFGFFRVRMGESALDVVPTSWHLSVEDRRRTYETIATPENQEGINAACLGICDLLHSIHTNSTSKPSASIKNH